MSDKSSVLNNIAKSTALLMILTIFVKVVGFIKQATISYYYGASAAMDAYLVVSDFISEIGVMFFLSVGVVFVSLYSGYKSCNQQRNMFVSNTFICLLGVSLILVILVAVLSKQLVGILAPGFPIIVLDDISHKISIFSILLLNICISNLCISILNSEKQFVIAKSIGLIQSVCIISACFIGAEKLGIDALYYGWGIYYIVENLFLFSKARRYFVFKIFNPIKDTDVRRLIRLSVPVFVGYAIVQINVMIDKAIASNLETGSVSCLSYGSFLFSTIQSVIVASSTTVLYTYFSEFITEKKIGEIVKSTKNGLQVLMAILIPVSLCCYVNHIEIVRFVYGRGNFDDNAIMLTSISFVGYSIGLVFIAFRDVFMQVLYACKKTKITMINGVVGVVINVILSIALSRCWGVFGIAFADSIAYVVLAVISYYNVYKIIPEIKNCFSVRSFCVIIISLISSLCCGKIMYGLMCDYHFFIRMLVDSVVVFSSYYLVLHVFKHDSVEMMYMLFKKRVCGGH